MVGVDNGIIGIDFDNTIVSYERLFAAIASELGFEPGKAGTGKLLLRNHLRATGREQEWTAIQGRVYGLLINEAEPFPGVMEFLKACLDSGRSVRIISHRTRYPILGEPVDLHQAARDWLGRIGILDLVPEDSIYFECTREIKVGRIGQTGCGWFIDDLMEVFEEPSFPPGIRRVLFDPHDHFRNPPIDILRARSWMKIKHLLLV